MCRHADARNTPTAVAMSLVFGGCTGTLVAASFGLVAGAGFVAGACLVFLFIWVTVLRSRQVAATEEAPRSGVADEDRSPRTIASAEST